jgi:hypothetical protein
MRLTAFVSSHCQACQRFMHLLRSAPTVLARTRVRVLELDPEAVRDYHRLGGYMAPGLLIERPDGTRQFVQGGQAAQAVVGLAA